MPTGDGAQFLTYEGLPSDFYLRLARTGAMMLRGELPVTEAMPATDSLPPAGSKPPQ